MIVYQEPDAITKLEQQIGLVFNYRADHCLARYRLTHEGNVSLMGGVIFSRHTGASIEVHVGSFEPNWLNRALLWMSFDYPFTQLGVQKLFAPIPETNKKALQFNLKLGFKHENTILGAYEDADMMLMSMRKEECPWLGIMRK